VQKRLKWITIKLSQPVVSDNSICCTSNPGPKVSTLLANRSSDSRSFHLALGVHNDSSIIFEVHVDSVLAAPQLALADDDGWHDLLPEVGLTLLDGGHDHVTDAGGRQAVEPTLDALDGDDVEVLGACVVRAVHGRCDGETQRHAELVPRRPSPPALRHGGGSSGGGGSLIDDDAWEMLCSALAQ